MADDTVIGTQSKDMKELDSLRDMAVDEFGTSTNPMQHQTEALKARIFHGANRIEFSFFGRGKGEQQRPTPTTFGKREMQDMRELAEINDVETSTHASVGVSGLSGLNQNRFDEHSRKDSIDEVKRAIFFAANATTGGAVVFHTGEAPRPLYSRYTRYNGSDGGEFQLHPYEKEEEMHYLVDPVAKQIISEVKENVPIAIPVARTDEDGNVLYLKDENGKEVVDEIFAAYDPIHNGRIPIYEYDEHTGDIKTELTSFKDYREKREAEIDKVHHRLPNEKEREQIIKEFFQWQQQLELSYNYGFGMQAETEYRDGIKQRDKIIKALDYYKKLKETIPEEDWWKFKKDNPYSRSHGGLYIPPDVVDPVEYLESELQANQRRLVYGRETALSGKRRVKETLKRIERSTLIENYAEGKAAESMGEIGVYAYEMTHKAHNDYKTGKKQFDIKNDIYIAPENLFPESYGSHPQELRKLVSDGRREMIKRLESQYKMGHKEAEEAAKKHIRATLDIGHMNMWKKYFISKEGESLEERDKRFNKWLIKEAKKLCDDGTVGHIHINDNFGFHDEHLSAGDGSIPIKDFVKNAKDAGLNEFIVESGSFNANRSLPDAWHHFDSPVYHISVPGVTQDTWSDFWHSYFGRTEGPRYIVGGYAPSEQFRGAPFYTGLGLE